MSGLFTARANEIFARLSPYGGEGLRNHCWRIHRITCLLLEQRRLELHRDLVYLASMLHDLGLVTEEVEGANYLERSRALFRRETSDMAIEARAADIIDECLLKNHRLVPGAMSPEAECFRKAVWVEHTRGLLRYGLDPASVRRVFAELPRDNFDHVLLDFARRVLTREPLTLAGIFFS